ncbi:MAG TPA: hypothetical protein PJ986_10590 [Gammaproteobacteria bacterium]|nr:hypothetical protein [Gammaproteobacteria bacterium]
MTARSNERIAHAEGERVPLAGKKSAGNRDPDKKPAAGRKERLPSPEAPISVSEYARTRGVSPQAVRDAIHAGKLGRAASRNPAGHYVIRPLAADRAWGKSPREGMQPAPLKKIDPETVRLRRERDELKLERDGFELDVKRGMYLRRDELKEDGERIGTETRVAVLMIANRLAIRLAGEGDHRACREMIAREADQVCSANERSLMAILEPISRSSGTRPPRIQGRPT